MRELSLERREAAATAADDSPSGCSSPIPNGQSHLEGVSLSESASDHKQSWHRRNCLCSLGVLGLCIPAISLSARAPQLEHLSGQSHSITGSDLSLAKEELVRSQTLSNTTLESLDTIEKALACFHLTSLDPKEVTYPEDAEQHFEEIYANITRIVPAGFPAHSWAGYSGPWMENHWINNFTQRWFQRPEGTKLKDIFGPFIPIFVPWADLAVKLREYPRLLITTLQTNMRKNVLYITVSQHDLGIFGGARNTHMFQGRWRNMLVLSSGGYGHVPLPLLKAVEHPLPELPVSSRRYFASFVGSATDKSRVRMQTLVKRWSNRTNKETLVALKPRSDWRSVLQNSSVALVPRGFGRNSFRCGELLQMGRSLGRRTRLTRRWRVGRCRGAVEDDLEWLRGASPWFT